MPGKGVGAVFLYQPTLIRVAAKLTPKAVTFVPSVRFSVVADDLLVAVANAVKASWTVKPPVRVVWSCTGKPTMSVVPPSLL